MQPSLKHIDWCGSQRSFCQGRSRRRFGDRHLPRRRQRSHGACFPHRRLPQRAPHVPEWDLAQCHARLAGAGGRRLHLRRGLRGATAGPPVAAGEGKCGFPASRILLSSCRQPRPPCPFPDDGPSEASPSSKDLSLRLRILELSSVSFIVGEKLLLSFFDWV